ncbi:MAG: beta/gamma crystallin-related protein, partial [Syntrophaceae bacterium]
GIGRYDLDRIGLPNDCISSLRVPAGLKVTLFQDAGFSGNSITFTDSASFVGSFDDKTSSIVIERVGDEPAVDIYEYVNYQGMHKQLGIGRYNIGEIGLPNDSLSSLRVGPGLKVNLFENGDFTGSSVSYVHDTSSIGSFNNKTSSIVVEAVQSPVVEVFERADYKGRCCVLGPGGYDVAGIGLPNDSLSSLRVPRGLEVTLYENAGFAGANVRYTANTSFVGSFNDKTSSIRVRRL